ncbi:rhomboid family intramembrane serine protease [Facklamia lactis]|uniref:rhomboid family intramembrane serine protease n=1 Tax=Facklamia lactis TaxID=2749967 RepID=UPI0018CEA139
MSVISFKSINLYQIFGHVLGHINWTHLFNNMLLFLVIGPILEEKYGPSNIFFIILSTALVTRLIHFIFLLHSHLHRASVVFLYYLLQ